MAHLGRVILLSIQCQFAAVIFQLGELWQNYVDGHRPCMKVECACHAKRQCIRMCILIVRKLNACNDLLYACAHCTVEILQISFPFECVRIRIP